MHIKCIFPAFHAEEKTANGETMVQFQISKIEANNN